MNNNIKQVLENALKVLSDNKDAMNQDGYQALAADMDDVMWEIRTVLSNNVGDYDPRKDNERPKVGVGLDQKTYLVFKGSWDAGEFLTSLGIDEHSVGLHHFGGYENAILIGDLHVVQKGHRSAQSDDCVKDAETWLKAISTWLLENDHDMNLPDGVLDTDPLDIAERLSNYKRKL